MFAIQAFAAFSISLTPNCITLSFNSTHLSLKLLKAEFYTWSQ